MRFVWVAVEKKGGATPTDWTCPMHPEVSNPGPGICPSCKMDLVPREGSGRFVAEMRPVRTGPSDGTRVAVLSGLNPGDRVITSGHEDLFPGAAVEPEGESLGSDGASPSRPSNESAGRQHG
jgi:multidrug efflux pump subunit AcrA (membrane-fusion protein)